MRDNTPDDVRGARETVDELEDEHVDVPDPDENPQVDPAAATDSGTGDPASPAAGDAEPPD
ncbi:hypothetical protein ACPXCG_12435 [Gordonia sp. DT218]|uniref:hypothetical protein n=1 Tax=Gordonia sp. DT218 TaxID=3416659 RepID=UPI003CE9828E